MIIVANGSHWKIVRTAFLSLSGEIISRITIYCAMYAKCPFDVQNNYLRFISRLNYREHFNSHSPAG